MDAACAIIGLPATTQHPLLALPHIYAKYGLIPHSRSFFTRVRGFFQLFQIHIRIRLRSHWSIGSRTVFMSANLKYPTQPRIVSWSTCFRLSYPIPLLRPVSVFNLAFSLAMLLGCVRSLHPSPVL